MRVALVLAACLIGLAADSARADYFSFSVGGGGYGGGPYRHHGGYCGPGWGFGYWAPPPMYYAPPPVVYAPPPVIQQPVIIQQQAPAPPATSYGAAAPSSNVANNRLPSPPTRTAATGSQVVIRNAGSKGVPVAFLIDEKSEELRDGQTRSYSGSSHVVEFDRGGDLGTARYELSGGLYSFTVGDNGWELVRDSNVSRTADRPALRRNDLPIEVRSR
jgi:hypothetical protein